MTSHFFHLSSAFCCKEREHGPGSYHLREISFPFLLFPFSFFSVFRAMEGVARSISGTHTYQLICISDGAKAQLVRSTEGSSYLGIKLAKKIYLHTTLPPWDVSIGCVVYLIFKSDLTQ